MDLCLQRQLFANVATNKTAHLEAKRIVMHYNLQLIRNLLQGNILFQIDLISWVRLCFFHTHMHISIQLLWLFTMTVFANWTFFLFLPCVKFSYTSHKSLMEV